MRNVLIACACVLFSSSAFAQSVPYEGGYIEAFAGISLISDVDTEEFSFTSGSDEFTVRSSIEYGNEFRWGLEAGIDGYPRPNLRIGASWDYINAEFDNVHLTGTLNDDPFSEKLSSSDLESLGLNSDSAISVVAGHLYYNIPFQNRDFQPYIGVGAGAAIIEHADTEFVTSVTAGMRAAIGQAAYIGARYRFYYIVGPEDDFGALYDPINVHSFSVVLGWHVN